MQACGPGASVKYSVRGSLQWRGRFFFFTEDALGVSVSMHMGRTCHHVVMESLSSSDGPLNFRGQWEVIILSDLFTHMKHDQFWIVGDRRSRANTVSNT